jgi:hypothetical protein
MKEQFSDTNSSSVYSKRLVLTAVQIKSWVSTEKARRTAAGKRLVAQSVIGRAAAELLADVDPGTSKSTDGE